MHTRPIGIKNPYNPDADLMLPMVIEKQRFGATFALIVAGPYTDAIDISPVRFSLGMNGGITVYFRCRGLKNSGPKSFGQAQHIDRAVDIDLGGLHRIILIVNRRSRTGQVINFVHFQIKGKGNIMSNQLEVGILQ